MNIEDLYTRVFRTYVDAISSPRIVAIKQLLSSTTGWMISVLNQSNNAVNTSTEKAAEALASANASKASANSSADSATNANNTWNMLQAWSRNFNSHFLGSYDSDPTKDPDGNDLIDHAEYYNTATKHVRVYSTATGKWGDQDETTEVEMQAAQVASANAASSASSANSSNNAAQAANNAAQAAMNSVNQSMFWMNTWWLGPSNGAPTQDRNGKALQAGNTYYDLGLNKLRTWNGSSWFTGATSEDVDYIKTNFVNIDGSNAMTGALNINTNAWVGNQLTGSVTTDNNWYTTPAFVPALNGPVNVSSAIRTCYTKSTNKSYLDLSHAGTANSKGSTLFLWSDGKVSTSGDIIVGNDDRGSASVYALNFSSNNGDIAEYYKSKRFLACGTVVSVSREEDEDQELTETVSSVDTLGVISSEPGLTINNSIDEDLAYPVALTGRVPVRVVGPASKGDPLYLSITPGVMTADSYLAEDTKVLGFALFSKPSEGEDLLEVALKL